MRRLTLVSRSQRTARVANAFCDFSISTHIALSARLWRRLGIAPGDTIRVSTRRGAIELKARADAALQPGLVFTPFCYAEAAANVLTNPQLDPIGKIPEFKFCAAKVEPVSSKLAAE